MCWQPKIQNIALAAVIWLTACAHSPEIEDFKRIEPSHYYIDNVPFVVQLPNECGPSTLSMALEYARLDHDLARLRKQTMTDSKGSLQTSLLSSARRSKAMVVSITNSTDLFHEIAAGNPVIVFQNVALSWRPQYHYALVTGYDRERGIVRMHSGQKSNTEQSIAVFMDTWIMGDRWAIVIVAPGMLSATGTEFEHVRAAAALESLSDWPSAHKSYLAILKRWPSSEGAMIGLGNSYYRRGDYVAAEEILRKALMYHPNSKTVQINYHVVKSKLRDLARSNRDGSKL